MKHLKRPVAVSLLVAMSILGGPGASLAAELQAPGLEVSGATTQEIVLGSPAGSPELLASRSLVPSATAPDEPLARATWVVAQAESKLDAGRYGEALALLDANPFPTDAIDLVALRRAEAAQKLGQNDRARAELQGRALAGSTNRVLLIRAAQVAESIGEYGLAGDFWARASKTPTWYGERVKQLRTSVLDFLKAGRTALAAEQLLALAGLGAGQRDLVSMVRDTTPPTDYHAGLFAQLDGNVAEAKAAYRRYLNNAPQGEFAAAAKRQLDGLNGVATPDDVSGWDAVRSTNSAQAYRVWADTHPNSSMVPDARFYEALAQYSSGEVETALAIWQAGTVPSAGAENRARALYWAGKALEQLGRPDEAHERWETAAGLKPSSYYSVRAADRLNGSVSWPAGGKELPAMAPNLDEAVELEAWFSGWAPASQPNDKEAAILRRAPLFAGLGLQETAGAELDLLIENSSSPRVVYAAGRTAVENGLWLSSVRAGMRLAKMAPEKSPLDVPTAVRRLAFPVGYRDTVASESAKRDLGPLLLLSLIRQESLFDRFAVSGANAMGLAQVMPSTGKEIAQQLGRKSFSPEDLFDPDLAVAFGARYLSGQITYFKGDVFRAVAAYNAGAGAARSWVPGADPDIFVEAIPYGETKEYVKSIYQFHAAYRSLLGSK
jgi:soluble lytic murein transglycosylase-like protein